MNILDAKQKLLVDCVWNVMAHAQKPDFAFRRNGRVHLNRRGRQCSRLLAAEVCSSAVVMLDTPWSELVWRVLAAHSIFQFPLHFSYRAAPCAITFQLESNKWACTCLFLWRSVIVLFHSQVEGFYTLQLLQLILFMRLLHIHAV